MFNFLTILIGKFIQKLARLRGGGSALPGLVIEKINPNFTRNIISKLPYGVAVISGTNGKTTTTKIAVELLSSQGLRVFTNRTGSNFERGITAALLNEASLIGKLNADIAVLELDEAHAVKFINKIRPDHCLILNVMRDQLDRFGEIDNTARMLDKIVKATKKNVVLNREDPRIVNLAKSAQSSVQVNFFGLSKEMQSTFPNDNAYKKNIDNINQKPIVVLSNFDNTDTNATFSIDGQTYVTSLKLSGVYNVYNSAAALALTRSIIGDSIDYSKLFKKLSCIKPAFGRGEIIKIDEKIIELVLVKNPSGFQLSLSSSPAKNTSIMIAINDNYADGRDMSWLWDVDFTTLRSYGVDMVSGVRAYDMALRLQHDDVDISKIDTNLESALGYFLSQDNPRKRIYCTYTAMLKIRRQLSKKVNLEKVL